MNDKKFYIGTAAAVLILISSIIVHTTRTPIQPAENVDFEQSNELVVAIPHHMPGLIATPDGTFGYHHDIVEAYASATGLTIRILSVSDSDAAKRKLHSGKADIALGIMQATTQEIAGIPLYSSSFVVLGQRPESYVKAFERSSKDILDLLSGHKTLISRGFKSSNNYESLLDLPPGSEIYASSIFEAAALSAQIAAGSYDFYVCEKSEAQQICTLDRNIVKVGEFEESIVVSALFGKRLAGLGEDFTAWFQGYSQTNEFATLAYQYFERGTTSRPSALQVHSVTDISPYDGVMRQVCEREGADWRLMAAIAYSESRFKPDVVSNKGAKGLMQIMPSVARHFGVSDDEVMNPEVNLTLGVKLLNNIANMMKIPAHVSYQDRMSLVLASYNCGVGHVADARRLASKHGMDPNSWNDVSYFLVKKAEPEYYGDEVVRNGVFRGSGQTIAFVKSVMGRYTSYCTIAAI